MTTISNVSAFLPTQISGCSLWLDAADPTTFFQDTAGTILATNNSQVQLWKDKSSTSNNATNTQTTMLYKSTGLNNLPSIFFPGTQTSGFSLSGSKLPNGSSDASYFFVINKNSSSNQVFFTHGGSTNLKQFYATTVLAIDRSGVALINDTNSIQNLNTLISCVETSLTAGVNGYRNGNPFTTNGATNIWNVDTTAAWLGSGSIARTTLNFSGNISEVIVYSNGLSLSQRQQVEGYLAWKWNLQASLPTSHPYYNNPILTNTVLSTQLTNPIFNTNTSVFSPTQIGGCALWLDGADQNSIISSVLQDKSGNSRNSLSNNTVTLVPNRINNLSAFSWPRLSRAYGNATFTSGNNLTFFFLGTLNSSSDSYGRIFTLYTVGAGSAGESSPSIIRNSSASQLYIDEGIICSVTYGVPFLISITYATNSKVTYLNGSIINSNATTYTFNYPQYGLGSDPRLLSTSAGNMGETIIYVGTLSNAQRQQVEGYLMWKWGLQTQLQLGFLPPQVSGCSLWLDGSDTNTIVYSSGSNMSQWNDKSGNGNNMITYVGTTPSYSAASNGVYFSGAVGFSNANLSASLATESGFAVINFPNTTATNTIFGCETGTGGRQFRIDTGGIRTNRGGVGITLFTNSGQIANSNRALVEFIANGTTLSHYLNGSLGGSSNLVAYTSALYTSIGIRSGTGEGATGIMNELILFQNVALTTSQQQQVEGYLAWKWGLQASLPSTHPYYYKNPIPTHSYYYNQALPNLILPKPLQNPSISFVSGFLPTQFSGISLWLDSADLTTISLTGSNISQWSDKSGQANNATQATSSNQPFLTSAGILFNGGQNLNFANPNALASNTTFSVFVVEQRATSSNTNFILAGSATSANQDLHYGYNSSGVFRFGFYGNDLDYTVPAYSAGSEPYRLWFGTQSSTGRSNYLNGTLGASDTNTTLLTSWNGGNIGKNIFGAGTAYYLGTIKEILFFKPNLTTNQQQQVEGYLAWKWGLQKNLPPLHPYILFPPN